jgi:hypothetical protein
VISQDASSSQFVRDAPMAIGRPVIDDVFNRAAERVLGLPPALLVRISYQDRPVLWSTQRLQVACSVLAK